MDNYTAHDIVIRPTAREDRDALYAAVRESIDSTYPFQAWCHPAYSLADAERYLLTVEKARAEGREHAFFIVSVSEPARILGIVALLSIDRKDSFAALGYFVRDAERSRGLATLGCQKALQFAFDDLGLNRVEILIDKKNLQSQRVAKKLGATKEGCLAKRIRWNDEFRDADIYALFGA